MQGSDLIPGVGRCRPCDCKAASEEHSNLRQKRFLMTQSTAATQVRTRRIVHRTFGNRQGPITRLMSPSDLGSRLKPFVFLDLFDDEGYSFSGFGWHPHSGIATLTYLWEGSVRYERHGAGPSAGVLACRRRAMVQDARRRTGIGGGCRKLRLIPLDSALARPAARTGTRAKQSVYQKPQDVHAQEPAAVLLGTLGEVSSPLKAPSSITIWPPSERGDPGATRLPPITRFAGSHFASEGSLSLSLRGGRAGGFEKIESAIDFRAEVDTEFVLGSAASHPYDLVLGHYSVTRAQHRFRPGNDPSPKSRRGCGRRVSSHESE